MRNEAFNEALRACQRDAHTKELNFKIDVCIRGEDEWVTDCEWNRLPAGVLSLTAGNPNSIYVDIDDIVSITLSEKQSLSSHESRARRCGCGHCTDCYAWQQEKDARAGRESKLRGLLEEASSRINDIEQAASTPGASDLLKRRIEDAHALAQDIDEELRKPR